MKDEDIDAMLARHADADTPLTGPRAERVSGIGGWCLACATTQPCDARTALLALRDALAERDQLWADLLAGGRAADDRRAALNAAEAKVRDLEAQRDAVLALCDDVGDFRLHPGCTAEVRAAMGAT